VEEISMRHLLRYGRGGTWDLVTEDGDFRIERHAKGVRTRYTVDEFRRLPEAEKLGPRLDAAIARYSAAPPYRQPKAGILFIPRA
jgi:hypothetical protein